MKTKSVSNVSNNLNSTKLNMPSKLLFDGRFVPEVNYTNVSDKNFPIPYLQVSTKLQIERLPVHNALADFY